MRIAQIIATASSAALVCAFACSSIPSGNVLPGDCAPICGSGEVCVVKSDNDAGSPSAQPHCEPDEGCGSCDCLIKKKCGYSDSPVNQCSRTPAGEVQLYCGYV